MAGHYLDYELRVIDSGLAAQKAARQRRRFGWLEQKPGLQNAPLSDALCLWECHPQGDGTPTRLLIITAVAVVFPALGMTPIVFLGYPWRQPALLMYYYGDRLDHHWRGVENRERGMIHDNRGRGCDHNGWGRGDDHRHREIDSNTNVDAASVGR